MNEDRIVLLRRRCAWLDPATPVPHELAERLVAVSDRWRKRDGSVVESPGMSKHVIKRSDGWAIEYGANILHVEDGVRRAARLIARAYEDLLAGGAPNERRLEREIQSAFSACVSHRTSRRYAHYPIDGNDLVFGVHFIDTRVAARLLITESGLREAAQLNRRRRKNNGAKTGMAPYQESTSLSSTNTNAVRRRVRAGASSAARSSPKSVPSSTV